MAKRGVRQLSGTGCGEAIAAPPRRPRARGILPTLLLLATFLGAGAASPMLRALAQDNEVWILVDTGALTLSVMRGEKLLHRYDNIAIGSNGPTLDKRIRDEKTPLGEYRIDAIRPSQRFHVFMSIDYPTLDHLHRAVVDGRISLDEYRRLLKTWSDGHPLPQDTVLGGYLGIHGLGNGDEEVHRGVNWTDGCVALTNEEIDDLAGRIGVGTRVSIR